MISCCFMSFFDKVSFTLSFASYVSVERRAKWDYYNKLDHKTLTDNKTFWKTVKRTKELTK